MTTLPSTVTPMFVAAADPEHAACTSLSAADHRIVDGRKAPPTECGPSAPRWAAACARCQPVNNLIWSGRSQIDLPLSGPPPTPSRIFSKCFDN